MHSRQRFQTEELACWRLPGALRVCGEQLRNLGMEDVAGCLDVRKYVALGGHGDDEGNGQRARECVSGMRRNFL